MKNIINEKPATELHGRLMSTALFVHDNDIEGKNVLDIGCGYGWFVLNTLRRGVSHVVGIEVTEKDLETAKKHVNDKRVNFRIASATNLPFDNDTFDTVVSWEVLEHIPRGTEIMVFQEVRRVLKSNGAFYMSTPYNSLIRPILDPAWWITGHRHYSKSNIIRYAKETGFLIECMTIKSGIWELFGIWNMYISKWIFRRKSFFNDFVNRKQNMDYAKNNGFNNLFLKCTKRSARYELIF